ncbi:MAG: Abi family protein [Flavobacteriia bacterium]|nr:Abi family protein [Flavobacteriia bacterium]
MEFTKLPKTYEEQAEIWKSRGLIVKNEERTLHYLKNISYYRLSAYALPFQQTKDKFNDGTSFDDILNLYLFDRELRLIVFNAIERIEVAVRSIMIYQLSHKYGSHWQDNERIFSAPYNRRDTRTGEYYTINVFEEIQSIIRHTSREKHPETFIKHYNGTYTKPKNPPSWMCMEVFTLGQLSKLYNGLRHNDDKVNIANHFGLHFNVFKSWLHTLTYVRNICGHHGRLWNREIAIEPLWLKKPKLNWLDSKFDGSTNRTFYSICMMKYLLQTVNANHHIKQHLNELIAKYPSVPIQFMGIPSEEASKKIVDWQNEALWK